MKIRSFHAVILTAVVALGSGGAAMGVTTVSRSGNTITITGGDEVNFVTQPTAGSPGPLLYRDAGGLAFGDGCIDVGNFTVQCGDLDLGLVANVSLGGGNDTFKPEDFIFTSPVVNVDLGAGDDTMNGTAGNDTIAGGPGVDNVNGRGGQDTLDGGAGNDRLSGANGDDTITGGPGLDSLFGDGEFSTLSGYGNDTLRAQDGEIDSLSCSFGADTAVADANDVFDVLTDCESRTIAAGPAPGPGQGPGQGPGGATPLTVRLGPATGTRIGRLASGRPLTFTVTPSGRCHLVAGALVTKAEAKRLRIGSAQTVLAVVEADLPSAGTFQASLRIKKRYRAKLKAVRRATITLIAGCANDDGSVAAVAPARRVVVRR